MVMKNRSWSAALLAFFLSSCLYAQNTPPAAIAVNQLGFYPRAPKIAIITGAPATDIFYVIAVAAAPSRPDTIFSGRLGPLTPSANSSLSTRLADFSSVQKEGVYRIAVPGMENSYPFRIGPHVLAAVSVASLKGYYYQRSAMALTPEYAGGWSRPAGHPDTAVLIHPSAATASRPVGAKISATGGWYDAGDYNKYIVNSGISMGTLLDAYEDFPAYFDTLHTNIPPVYPAGLPDILNEALYNLRWMLSMQDPDDGGVYNKCTNAAFDGMVMPGVTKAPRYVVQKGAAATLDFAAVMAQASRILRKFQRQLPGLSDTCLHAAVSAWQWALQHPDQVYDQGAMNKLFQPAITTGGYGDRNFADEWFWAAVELMISSGGKTKGQYEEVVKKYIGTRMSLPSWANVQMIGNYSLLRYRRSLPASWEPAIRSLQQQLLQMADGYLEKISSNAFHTVMGSSQRDFAWGSNSVAANQGMLLVNAWLQGNDQKYLAPALDNLDYLLGRNATGYCFITGMGAHYPMHPHHRPSIADGIVSPVPGLLVGGPNPGRQDHQQYTFLEPETSYTDQDGAYASNEIAINWNAPLVYLAGAMEALQYTNGYSKTRQPRPTQR